ncbi:ABC transporter substrate-binding protein [Bosea thiooxidans]
MPRRLAAALLFALLVVLTPAMAQAFVWARSGDALTLDPHVANEGPTVALVQNIYEGLTERDRTGRLGPLLAVSWRMLLEDPTVWEFKLRGDVTFQDGSRFSADDVVFSYHRAMQPNSGFRDYLASVVAIEKIDDLTVRIRTRGPSPTFIENTPTIFVMSKDWAERHGAVQIPDEATSEANFANAHTNGTGAFVLVSRQPYVRTELKRNDAYWNRGHIPLGIAELTYRPISHANARVAALLAGSVDFLQDVPIQDLPRLHAQSNLTVTSGVENRTVFLGFDVASPAPRGTQAGGRNPFADIRVRRAISIAIDRDQIQRAVMRGEALPSGLIISPLVNGWTSELDTPPPFAPGRARELLAEAGYPEGFSTTVYCPNDRYAYDEETCRALVPMLARVGIRLTVVAQPQAAQSQALRRMPGPGFFLAGWGSPTYDSEQVFSSLYHSRDGQRGFYNATGYSDPQVDALIGRLSSEIDPSQREAIVARLWQKLRGELIYLPLYHQTLSYAMKEAYDIPVDVSNTPKLKLVAAPSR